MKFVILIFALLINIKLCFRKLFDNKKLLINSKEYPELDPNPIFLENRNTELEKLATTSSYAKRIIKGYKMKIHIFKETGTEKDKPMEIKGTVKLGDKFQIFTEDDKLKNTFNFLR